jgi:hypothetical protein
MGCQSSKGDVAAIVSSYEGKKAAHSTREASTPKGRGVQGNLVELHPDAVLFEGPPRPAPVLPGLMRKYLPPNPVLTLAYAMTLPPP